MDLDFALLEALALVPHAQAVAFHENMSNHGGLRECQVTSMQVGCPCRKGWQQKGSVHHWKVKKGRFLLEPKVFLMEY